eukprot:6207566-Pleurochrysis_carterae.AAC.2
MPIVLLLATVRASSGHALLSSELMLLHHEYEKYRFYVPAPGSLREQKLELRDKGAQRAMILTGHTALSPSRSGCN